MFTRISIAGVLIVLIAALALGFSVLAGSDVVDNPAAGSSLQPDLSEATTPTAQPAQQSSAQAIEPVPTHEATALPKTRTLETPTPFVQPDETPTPAVGPEPVTTPEPDLAPEQFVETPVQISIPTIGVDTTVEWVGLDANGNMDVPSGYETTAWFQHGVRPGMTGNAVIAGHFDSPSGPAIFFDLSDLQPGDEIVVTTSDGEQLVFRVDRLEAFNAASAPRYEIFGPSTGKNLNLITCSGTFDPAARAYDERLVVYTTLVTSE